MIMMGRELKMDKRPAQAAGKEDFVFSGTPGALKEGQ